MVVTSDLEYRQRDVNAALEGSVDLAIAIEIFAYLLVALAFFLGAASPRGRRLPPVFGTAWAFVAILVASVSWAPSPQLAAVRGGQVVVVAAVATSLARRADARDWAYLAHAYVWLVTSFIMLGLVWRVSPGPLVAGRFNWAATHPVVASSLLVISVLILTAWTRQDSGPRFMRPELIWGLLVVHTGALLATETRGAIFSLLVGFITWIALAFSRRRDIAVIAVLLAPLTFFLGQSVFQSFLLRGESVEQLQSLNSRTDLWSEAVALVSESPWFGRGYFSARELFLESIGLGGAHNAYIEVLVSAGIIGSVALAAVLWRAVRVLKETGRDPQVPLVGAILAGLLTNGLTAQYWAQGGTGANVWLFLTFGWIASLRISRSRTDDTRRGLPT